MKYQEKWIMETIHWWCPWGPYTEEKVIGATPNHLEKETSTHVCIWEYVSPKELLRFIDPFFKPLERGGVFDFFEKATLEGRLFAPPQVSISVRDLGVFPENHWSSDQAKALKRASSGERLSLEEKGALIRRHEGRHRLWYASYRAKETLVPIQVWLEKTPREVESLEREVLSLERELQSTQAEKEALTEELWEYERRYGVIDRT